MKTENETIKILKTRRSVRKYQSQQITEEELKAVLEAGTYAPTSRGQQNPWIVAVQDKDIIAQLVKMNAHILGTNSNPYYDAPTIVLVFASNTDIWPNAIQDGSLVLGNMMNAAHAIGLASCWIHREFEMFQTDEGKTLMKDFGLPDGLIGIGALALGYEAQGGSINPSPRKEKYYRIIK